MLSLASVFTYIELAVDFRSLSVESSLRESPFHWQTPSWLPIQIAPFRSSPNEDPRRQGKSGLAAKQLAWSRQLAKRSCFILTAPGAEPYFATIVLEKRASCYQGPV